MNDSTALLVRMLVEKFPGLSELYRKHLTDNFGELLPHVFFGDFTRYVVSLYLGCTGESEDSNVRTVGEILECLENAYETGDEQVQELISVSFLENLPRPGETGSEIRKRMGPHLTEQLSVIG
jgi:hypothetical protein